jgi:hypothetical protein
MLQTEYTDRTDFSLSMAKANLLSLPFFACGIAMFFLFVWLHGMGPVKGGFQRFFELQWFLPTVILGVIAHEIIHGLTWKILVQIPNHQIKYGFQFKTLTPYAHCKVPIPISPYRWGAAMPLLLLGITPYIFSLLFANGWLLFFGIFFTVAAAGDMLILWLLRGAPNDALVEDHPANAGCYVYSKGEK